MDPVTENAAATPSTGNITSGTASEAMIKAAMSASSADTPAEGTPAPVPAGAAGDTPKPAGQSEPGATAAAKGTQVPTGQPATPAGNRGPVPLDRHETAVRNAREVGYKDAEKKYEAFKGYDPSQAAVSYGVARELTNDPIGFGHKLAKELGFVMVRQDQTAGNGKPTQETTTEFPQPRLRAEDGTLAYAADQIPQILEVFKRSIQSEYKPLLEDRENNQRTQREQAVVADVRETVTAALTEARKLPHFTQTGADGKVTDNPIILDNLRAIPAETRQRIGPIAAMYQAYQQFLVEHIYPSIDTAAEKRVRDSYSRKAATSQGNGHPTDQGGDGKKTTIRPGDVDGLARHMERLAETMTT